MLAAQLGLSLILLAMCSFTPGFIAIRRLRWRPLEKLCGSIALSLIVLYLVCFGAYCFAPRWLTVVCRGFSGSPFQFMPMKENIRCSILFHLLVPGG